MGRESSAVAAVVDRKGGIRVVVTEPWRMKFHVGNGEKIYVVPGVRVREPVSIGDASFVVEMATAYARVMRK